MTPDLIGRDVRISLADFAGNFVELEPYQRQALDAIEAVPEDLRRMIVMVPPSHAMSAAATVAYLEGKRGDRIIIDDPLAIEPHPIDQIMAAKLEMERRMESKKITARREEEVKPIAPRNRHERRAAKAKARRSGR